jgi:hypothetical protein
MTIGEQHYSHRRRQLARPSSTDVIETLLRWDHE